MTLAPATRQRIVRWLPALAWMGVIFVLSSQSGLRVSDDNAVDRPFRIVAHLATYAFLAGLLLYAVGGPRAPSLRALAGALVLTLLYAISDELHQAFVPARRGRVEDIGIDLVGAIIGLAVATAMLTALERRRSAQERRSSTHRL